MTTEAEYQRRFWSRVTGGDVSTCWIWTRGATSDGYGVFPYWSVSVRAHRWAYQHLIGPIPDGLVLDHLCRVRRCVNPWHLEPVTPAENSRRGIRGLLVTLAASDRATCGFGHPWSDENTYMTTAGRRACRACARGRDQRRPRAVQAAERVAQRAAERAARSCGVEGCEKPYSYNGYCGMHAERVRRNGHPHLQRIAS